MTTMKTGAAIPVTFSHHKYGLPLAVDASSNPRWTGIVADGEPHVLDFHEFLVVSDGTAEVVIGDRAQAVDGPTVIFTPPSVVRRVEVVDPLRIQLVVFSSDALRRAGWWSALSGMTAGPHVIHDPSRLQPLNGLAQLMAAELSSPGRDSALMLDALLAQFLVMLHRATDTPIVETPVLVERFDRLLAAHGSDQHSVSFYAATLGVTPDYLSSVVRAHHGYSAKSRIDQHLFSEAARMLASTRLSIADIGAALGFDEPSHFTRFFSRACGQSPSRFRAR